VILGITLPALLGVTEYGWWILPPLGVLTYLPKVAVQSPLRSWLILAIGIALILGYGLSREPRRGLVWASALFTLLIVLQTAGLLYVLNLGVVRTPWEHLRPSYRVGLLYPSSYFSRSQKSSPSASASQDAESQDRAALPRHAVGAGNRR
jgi:hypothetical protein